MLKSPCSLTPQMIGSILIKLKPQGEIKVRGNSGEDLYSLFLNVLTKNDKDLAEGINDSEKEKPLTISPLLKGAKSSQGYTLLFPNQSTSFRITYLKEELSKLIIKGFLFLSDRKEPLKFSNGEILIERVDWQQGNKANFTSFEEIFSSAQDERKVTLEFCSPTSLRSEEEENPFPLPEPVFSSLFKKWKAFSDVKIPALIEKEFRKIRAPRFRLKTEHVNFSDSRATGFMGKVYYELPETMSKEIQKGINALADFAFYSGVGYKTFLGMGQTRRVIKSKNIRDFPTVT